MIIITLCKERCKKLIWGFLQIIIWLQTLDDGDTDIYIGLKYLY